MSEFSGLNEKVLGHVLGLMNGSELSAEVLISDARKKSSPLHSYFEWDDSAAAAAWRVDQAEGIIRRVKVNVTVEPEKTIRVRAFAAKSDLGKKDSRGVYVALDRVFSDEDSRAALEVAMRRDINRLQSRYRDTELLFRLWDEEAED